METKENRDTESAIDRSEETAEPLSTEDISQRLQGATVLASGCPECHNNNPEQFDFTEDQGELALKCSVCDCKLSIKTRDTSGGEIEPADSSAGCSSPTTAQEDGTTITCGKCGSKNFEIISHSGNQVSALCASCGEKALVSQDLPTGAAGEWQGAAADTGRRFLHLSLRQACGRLGSSALVLAVPYASRLVGSSLARQLSRALTKLSAQYAATALVPLRAARLLRK